MATITCDCAGELAMTEWACKRTSYGGNPVKVLLMPTTGTLTVAGDTPTLAEIQAGIADSGVDKMVVIEAITNGQVSESSREEETGADTEDGLTNVETVNLALTGKLKRLDETTRANLLKLNCYSRLQMWYITAGGYIFGGATGYKVSNFFGPMVLEGYGTTPNIPVNLVWQHNLNATDPSAYDAGFLTLTNPAAT